MMNNRFWILSVTFSLLLAAAGQCFADETDKVERTMRFVDQSYAATELYNAGKTQEALAIFEKLLAEDADLDQDGYVAISVGDCFVQLGKNEEALKAYRFAGAKHPDLKSQIDLKLVELDLAGNITDELIENLRRQVQNKETNSATANLQLGRALEKRSCSRLRESIAAFHAALDFGSPWLKESIQNHVVGLEELADDFDFTITQLENPLAQLASMKKTIKAINAKPSPEIAIEKENSRWNVSVDKQPAVSIEIKTDKDGKKEILANGKAVKLTPTQELLIRRHQQRINQILLEAAGKINKPSENKQQ